MILLDFFLTLHLTIRCRLITVREQRVICPMIGQMTWADKCPVRTVTTIPIESMESRRICRNKLSKSIGVVSYDG